MSDTQGDGSVKDLKKVLSIAEMQHQIHRLSRINADVAEWKTIREITATCFPNCNW